MQLLRYNFTVSGYYNQAKRRPIDKAEIGRENSWNMPGWKERWAQRKNYQPAEEKAWCFCELGARTQRLPNILVDEVVQRLYLQEIPLHQVYMKGYIYK